MIFKLVGAAAIVIFLTCGCKQPVDPQPSSHFRTPPSKTDTSVVRAPSIQGGGTVGNGGDDTPLEVGSAWFLGNQSVRYCYVASPDFGVDGSVIGPSLHSALDQWLTYIRDLLLDVPSLHPDRGLRPGDPFLSLNYVFVPRCQGDEDLVFYLGVENELVRHARSRFVNPIAFAQRVAYDLETGRGRGFVWIRSMPKDPPHFPDWRLSSVLEAVVLHELGHVFGCGHVAGTIMDEAIVMQLRKHTGETSTKVSRARFARIDRLRMLLVPPGNLSFRMLTSDRSEAISSNPMPFLFTESPSEAESIHVTGKDGYEGNGISFFSSNRGWIEISGLRNVGRFRNDVPVFKLSFLRSGSPSETVSVSSRTESTSYVGQLEDGTGRMVLVHFNGDSFRIRITAFSQGESPRIILEF